MPGHLTSGIVLLHRFPFVVELLALDEGDLDFHQPFQVEIKGERNECEPVFLYFLGQLDDLSLVEKEFSLPGRDVVRPAGLLIFSNMEVSQPHLASGQEGIAVGEVGVSVPQRLDLGPHQRNPGFGDFQDVVLKASLAVGDDDLPSVVFFFASLFGHVI